MNRHRQASSKREIAIAAGATGGGLLVDRIGALGGPVFAFAAITLGTLLTLRHGRAGLAGSNRRHRPLLSDVGITTNIPPRRPILATREMNSEKLDAS